MMQAAATHDLAIFVEGFCLGAALVCVIFSSLYRRDRKEMEALKERVDEALRQRGGG